MLYHLSLFSFLFLISNAHISSECFWLKLSVGYSCLLVFQSQILLSNLFCDTVAIVPSSARFFLLFHPWNRNGPGISRSQLEQENKGGKVHPVAKSLMHLNGQGYFEWILFSDLLMYYKSTDHYLVLQQDFDPGWPILMTLLFSKMIWCLTGGCRYIYYFLFLTNWVPLQQEHLFICLFMQLSFHVAAQSIKSCRGMLFVLHSLKCKPYGLSCLAPAWQQASIQEQK